MAITTAHLLMGLGALGAFVAYLAGTHDSTRRRHRRLRRQADRQFRNMR